MASSQAGSTTVTVAAHQDQVRLKEKKPNPGYVSIVLTVLLMLAGVAIAALVVLYLQKGEKESPQACPNQASLANDGTQPQEEHTETIPELVEKEREEVVCTNRDCNLTGEEAVCTNRDCNLTAAQMARKMDFYVDPCSNFADYACGGFYKEVEIPRDARLFSTLTEIEEDNQRAFRKILENPVLEEDPEYLVKIKHLYQGCINEDINEKYGLDFYFNSTIAVKWPTLNPEWNALTFDISATTAEFAAIDIQPLFRVFVRQQLFNSSISLIHLSEPSFPVPFVFLTYPRNSSEMIGLQNVYERLAIYLGANPQTAHDDAVAFTDFLHELALIARSPILLRRWNWIDLVSWAEIFTFFDYTHIVGAYLSSAGIELDGSEEVVIIDVLFFQRLHRLVGQTDARTIQNVFGFYAARASLDKLTARLREIEVDFLAELYGEIQASRPLWLICQDFAVSTMWEGVTKEFVKDRFSEKAKADANRMIDFLLEVYYDIIDASSWMAESTRQEARLKLDHLGRKVGYPDTGFSVEDINDLYNDVMIFKDNFYQSRLNLLMFRSIAQKKTLLTLYDRSRWTVPATTINALYFPQNNEIVFPAAFLSSPVYSENNGKSLNFGFLGTIIGHEITHAFDPSGSRFDWAGNLRTWWTENDREVYVSRISCIVDQYSSFIHPLNNRTVDGLQTLGENIADDGGIKGSYRAYIVSRDRMPTEKPLPGLGLSLEQQFFVNYAQTWCQNYHIDALTATMQQGVHSPGRFRIIGALQNNPDFAEAFNCSAESYMNPIHKCSFL